MDKKEAIEVIKKNYPHVGFSGTEFEQALRTLVPELAESEDERIRKWIYNLVEILGYPADEDAEKELEEMQPIALAWLEKQKDVNIESIQTEFYNAGYEDGKEYMQKPAEWSEEDEKILNNTILSLQSLIDDGIHEKFIKTVKKEISWLKSLRPQPKQEPVLNEKDTWCCHAVWACVRDSRLYEGKEKESLLNFLQRIERWGFTFRDWKPSEEQMDALFNAVGDSLGKDYHNALSLLDFDIKHKLLWP